MITSIKGKIIFIENNYIILETHDIGYKIYTGNLNLKLKKNQNLFLWTYQVVRETALDLFGFKTINELKIFELLISISGIGPKVGLSIMNVTSPQSLKRAVISNSIEELTKVSGIGKKNAQKIIVELKNKIEKINIDTKENDNFDLEVYETLEALGFSRPEIIKALEQNTEKNIEKKIQEALKFLGKK
ncbi:MAG: Holliday junction branch migration protein RuvA [Candidatus Pacebacteria bacterium]|nr:Holliday junction branch migration protein RuvA [Candidatus Paceibacterota bacterium]